MTGSDRERDVADLTTLLYEHREDALTCYDHPESYCCVCGEHEVGGYHGHLAAVLAAHDKAVAAEAWNTGAEATAARWDVAPARRNPYRTEAEDA